MTPTDVGLAWLVGLFGYTGAYKFASGTMLVALARQRLLPAWALSPIARVLPSLEVCVALLLILDLTRSLGAMIALVLGLSFSSLGAIAVARGLRAPCACGAGEDEPLSRVTVTRGVAMAGVALAIVLTQPQGLSAPLSLIGLAFGAIGVLLGRPRNRHRSHPHEHISTSRVIGPPRTELLELLKSN